VGVAAEIEQDGRAVTPGDERERRGDDGDAGAALRGPEQDEHGCPQETGTEAVPLQPEEVRAR
jgi:hypothetical protein